MKCAEWYVFAQPKTASPGGSWLREAQTDEGQKAPNICIAVSIVHPDPHPALRATFPGGEGFGRCVIYQFSRERSKKTEAVFLVGSRESEGKSKSPPNRKCSLRFGKEEMSTEDKRRRLRRLVPSRSFLTRLRRPYLFSRKRKDRGEKSAWGRVWCVLPLNSGEPQYFRRRSTRWSPYEFLLRAA